MKCSPLRILLVSAAFCTIPLLLSCTTEPLEVSPDLKGSINLLILDASTTAPVSGVRAELVGKSSGRTSAAGQITFNDVRAGSYFVRLEKAGYETSQEPVTLGTAGTLEVAALTTSQTFRIHKNGVSIKGRLLLRPVNSPDTTAQIPAPGVRVELRSTATGTGSGNTIYPFSVRTATTSPTGHFTFDTLPELSSYTLTVPEFSNGGKLFGLTAASVVSGSLLAGQSYTHPNIVLNPVTSGTLQVFARSTRLESAQPWVFEFSSGIDTSRLAATSIQLRRAIGTGTPANIASRRTWNSDFTVLSVSPDSTGTGTWIAGSTYSVVLTSVRDFQNRVLATTTLTSLPVP
jgi:hypothetical protein